MDWSSILNLQHLRRQGINKWQWRAEKSRKIRRMCKVESLCPLWALSIRKGFKCSFDQTNQIWSIKLVPWSHYKQLNILHEFKWKINNLLLYHTFFSVLFWLRENASMCYYLDYKDVWPWRLKKYCQISHSQYFQIYIIPSRGSVVGR